MWKSWGDKFDILPHDEKERPRKTLKNVRVYIAIIIIINFVAGSLIFVRIRPEGSFYYHIPSIISLAGVITCLILFFVKWFKNNKECDLALLLASVIFAFMSYIVSPLF